MEDLHGTVRRIVLVITVISSPMRNRHIVTVLRQVTIIFQMPMVLVGPGKKPTTPMERSMVTHSGHIVHLMRGDQNNKDIQEFHVVVA